MPYQKFGAYDGFDNFAEVRGYYRRCRNTQHFILSDNGITSELPVCSKCGKSLTQYPKNHPDQKPLSNRCEYSPKTKKIRCMHYICAWEGLMQQICQMEY